MYRDLVFLLRVIVDLAKCVGL
ncbi:hypothetical protein F383_29364 [Gossypium arboreum]|uniref:Uncharacterized protein n=1 Tax=Gossypium arboreum TaxID=29729 RepID=A0A0B0PGV4_GOSAR|nr:hypothetical protein F383_29364 [Gossypium arboreum]